MQVGSQPRFLETAALSISPDLTVTPRPEAGDLGRKPPRTSSTVDNVFYQRLVNERPLPMTKRAFDAQARTAVGQP